MWQSYKQERGCLGHFLRLLAVCWPGAQSARDNRTFLLVTLRNSGIFTYFEKKFTDRLSSKLFLNM